MAKNVNDEKNKGKNFSKSKGARKYDKRRDPKLDKELDSKAPHNNDPGWYATNSTILNAAANIAFPVFAGKPVEFDPAKKYPSDKNSLYYPLNQPMVGGMVLKYHTLPGVSATGTDAINVAARNIYQFVRHANSGHANYDPQDYMLYLLAMDSLYSYYAWMVRIYGIAQSYSLTNRYMPKAMLEAMDIDCDNVQKHGNDFLYIINNAARKINSLAVPSGMSYYARHIWLNSHVWADDTSTKSQFYMYNPVGFYVYNETGNPKGGFLHFERLLTLLGGTKDQKFTIQNILTGFNTLFDAIINSEDCGIMMGDTLKAFGSNIAQVAPLDSMYQVYPEYNEEVLAQIHNIETTGALISDDVTQDPNTNLLMCRPNCSSSTLGTMNHFLDCKSDTPDSAEIMVNTRLKPVVTGSGTESTVTACGSEVIEGVSMFANTVLANGTTMFDTDDFALNGVLIMPQHSAAEIAASIARRCDRLTKLDWHPFYIPLFRDDTIESKPVYSGGIVGDAYNITPLTDETLKKMHDLAILSMFNVPSMGEFAISK